MESHRSGERRGPVARGRLSSPSILRKNKEYWDRKAPYKATVSGFRNAAIAGAVAAGPVIIGCRVIPWAKANLNYTAQALLISSVSIAAFFITAEKPILERAKQNSRTKFNKTL